jgi:hypothetical protein
MKAVLIAAIIFCGLVAVVTSDSAQTWTQTSAPTIVNWPSVASSAQLTTNRPLCQ